VLDIPTDATECYKEVFDMGNEFLEPPLVAYDSVVIKNRAEQILKVYKPDDTSKAIYSLNEN